MICYDDLIYIASSLGIEVVYRDMHPTQPLLDGYAIPRKNLIVLDESIRHTTHGLCVLAEELGHCLYPPLSNHVTYHRSDYHNMNQWDCDNLAVKVAKEENQAIFFATTILIPNNEFWEYYSAGPHEIWEWCDHFRVAEWFIRKKASIMRAKGCFRRRSLLLGQN